MIFTYCSNDIIYLKNIIKKTIIKNKSNNIFSSEYILIQNKCMAQWLQISLTKDIGFVCNLNFIFVNNFLTKIFQLISHNKFIYHKLNKNILTWIIMSIFNKYIFCKDINIIKKYLKSDIHHNKLIQLSYKLAIIFERYTIYRPNIIDNWERINNVSKIKDNNKWQEFIWKKIIKYKKKNYPKLYNEYEIFKKIIKILKNKKKEKNNNLKNIRLFIFDVFTLSQIHFKTIKELGKHFNIYILFNNPSKYIKKKNNKPKKINNVLLEYWDHISKNYMFYLKKINKNIKYKSKNIQSNNMLQNIQKNISHKKEQNKKNNFLFDKNDNSISIHICNNKKHEIEILHNYLLKTINKNKRIKLNEIIIIASNINKYIPFIDGIFNNYYKNRRLKYNILEKINKNEILKIIIEILNINNMNFDLNEIFNLLEKNDISDKFNMDKKKICFLKILAQKANIRNGLEKINKYYKTKKYTWIFGLERLFLGNFLKEKNGPWNKILPCDYQINISNNTIDNLQKFIKTLIKWKKKLFYKHRIKTWKKIINDLIKDFFKENKYNLKKIIFIKKIWNQIINEIKISKYTSNIHIKSLLYILENKINKKKIKYNLFNNKINFTSFPFIPLNPYKIICLIGMNHNLFPKKEKIINFDLVKYKKNKCDPNKENYDRYLFLKLILNVKKELYISYTKDFNTQNNNTLNESIIITELVDYISNNFYYKKNKKNNFIKNQKLIKKHLYNLHDNIIYNHPINDIKIIKPKINNFISYNKKIKNINFKNLLEFWNNPIKIFINDNLKIKFKEKPMNNLNKYESFDLNYIEKYKISKEILDNLINKKKINNLYLKYSLSGNLPYNNFGKFYWENIYIEMKNIAKNILISKKKIVNVDFKIKINKYYLKGSLNSIRSSGMIKWTLSKLNINIIMDLWLKHLIYSTLGYKNNSYILTKNNFKLYFSRLNKKIAKKYLKIYVLGYLYGINKPLILPIRSCWAWINTYFTNKNNEILINKRLKNKAIKDFYKEWYGNEYYIGEKNNIYIKNLIKNIDLYKIKKICKNSKKWLLPIVKFKKIKKIKK
ncbi:exodeoxyribonuclease V subunit gamma [Candidatus Purcelliella pentastirinorum]|uniref:exodeoxyribonuclease V subunit gamma n=1 Tax=Candidatus Purcelliella pentastirinorum TaxID=472834 RepID=UPI00237B8BDA|nr:exodeoxyribonuclease V subunit gamma [Candidatus Purcelliella pentastirinorum]WDR80708.1 exodeoxyribonuclease V subunit gamma [Candidatus Purcelliella pentastirinorum]